NSSALIFGAFGFTSWCISTSPSGDDPAWYFISDSVTALCSSCAQAEDIARGNSASVRDLPSHFLVCISLSSFDARKSDLNCWRQVSIHALPVILDLG